MISPESEMQKCRRLTVEETLDGFSVKYFMDLASEAAYWRKSEGWTRGMVDQVTKVTNIDWRHLT
jgi:hypothetical protein